MNEIDRVLAARADATRKISDLRELIQALDGRLHVLAVEQNVRDRSYAGVRMRFVEKPIVSDVDRLAEVAPELITEKRQLAVNQRALAAAWNAGADQQERLRDLVYVWQELVIGEDTRKGTRGGADGEDS